MVVILLFEFNFGNYPERKLLHLLATECKVLPPLEKGKDKLSRLRLRFLLHFGAFRRCLRSHSINC